MAVRVLGRQSVVPLYYEIQQRLLEQIRVRLLRIRKNAPVFSLHAYRLPA